MFGFKKAYTDEELLAQCLKGKASAQQALYERYAGKMLSVCFRYTGNDMDAEDVLVTAFVRVFEKLDSFNGQGSFEGWIRRIVTNEALMFLRKNKRLQYSTDLAAAERELAEADLDSHLEAEELMQLLQSLPDGYRTVFNLYAIEGYSHKEIAEQLSISEGTSKSQLSKARQLLQARLQPITR